MPRVLSCPRGHLWEEDDRATGDTVLCPVCGAQVQRATTHSLPSNVRQDLAPTVVQTTSWLPSQPPAYQELAPLISGYEILGEIGRGGMGVVYKARQLAAERVVALKVIRKDRLLDEEAVRRFR